MKIAVLGPKGTFSESAGIQYLKERKTEGEILYFSSIGETVKSLRYPSVDLAVVPLENSSDGYVQETLDLLLKEEVCIVNQVEIPIRLKLMGNVDSLEGIRNLYVQFKAKGQCRNLIRSLKGVSLIVTESNVDAFLRLKACRPGDAAIVPSHLSAEGMPFVLDDAGIILPTLPGSSFFGRDSFLPVMERKYRFSFCPKRTVRACFFRFLKNSPEPASTSRRSCRAREAGRSVPITFISKRKSGTKARWTKRSPD